MNQVDCRRRARRPKMVCQLYGLAVWSEVPLGLRTRPGERADLAIRLGEGPSWPGAGGHLVAWSPCPTHGVDIRVWRSPDGAGWVWNRGIGTFYIHPDGRTVEVGPEPAADRRMVRAVLLGPIITFVLHRRGRPTLHASAVLVEGRVVALVGGQGSGKSTLAAGFVARGHRFFTDDVLPLAADGGSVQAIPGPPQMKLWPDAAGRILTLEAGLPDVLPGLGKKMVRLDTALAPGPAPLAGIYILDRHPAATSEPGGTTIEVLRGHAALATLLAHTPNRSYLLAPEEARFLPLYAGLVNQGLVKRLTFPDGFERLDDVYRRILSDVS